MLRRDVVNISAGLLICGIGVIFAVASLHLNLGTVHRMGAGFFPFFASLILIGLGIAVLLPAPFREGVRPAFEWRALFLVSLSIVLFAVLVERVGLLPSVIVTALVACLADRASSLREAAILAVALAIGAWAIFVLGLQIPIPAVRGLAAWM